MYAMDAFDNSGKEFKYYFATRKKEGELVCQTGVTKPDGAAIYAILEEKPYRIVLIKQYRYPLGKYIYELPAGLIENGETASHAAARELYEETGLEFCEYTGGLAALRRSFYLAQGMSDENNPFVFGYARGSVSGRKREDSEDIQVVAADKAEAVRILMEEELSMRGACMLMMFINADENEPFAFLG